MSRRLVSASLRAREIGNDQAPAWFEHTSDFSQALPLEAGRQMMHHKRTEHHIERLIGKGDLLDHPDLELAGYTAPRRLGAGTGDLPWTWVNANDTARGADALLDRKRQCPRTAANVQHRLSRLRAGQIGGHPSQFP